MEEKIKRLLCERTHDARHASNQWVGVWNVSDTPSPSAKVPFVFLSERRLTCIMEKMHVLAKLCSGLSYSAAD